MLHCKDGFIPVGQVCGADNRQSSLKKKLLKLMTMAAVEVVVTEFVILALACFFLIRYYKGNMVTSDVAVAVYLSWVLGFAGILLLPYDISVAILDDGRITSLEAVWNFVYWR